MKVDDLYALSQLQYFTLDEGRIVMKDKSVGPIIDAHTHLALAYVRPHQFDLKHKHGPMEHYLPACCPIDLDVHMSKNFPPGRLDVVKKDLAVRGFGAEGIRRTHTAPNLLSEMKDLRIVASLLLPVDFPAGLSRNAEAYLDVAQTTEGILSAGSMHPFGIALDTKLQDQLKLGARGVKLHPNAQMFKPDQDRAMKLYKMCGDAGAFVFLHCGPVGFEPRLGRYLTQVRHYERPIRELPHTTFVLGHSGSLQVDQAIELQQKYKNVYLELASQSLPVIKTILEKGDPKRVVFGSDWPWYHQAIGIAKVLLATEGDKQLRRDVLYGNAARLLRLES